MTLEEVYTIFDSIQPNENGCMTWPRCSPTNYKTIVLDGKYTRAHVLSLERKLGRKINLGHLACHTCDIKSCVNQDHLYEGTRRSNMQDAIDRNQWNGPYFNATGDDHWTRKCPERVPKGDQWYLVFKNRRSYRGDANPNSRINRLKRIPQ